MRPLQLHLSARRYYLTTFYDMIGRWCVARKKRATMHLERLRLFLKIHHRLRLWKYAVENLRRRVGSKIQTKGGLLAYWNARTEIWRTTTISFGPLQSTGRDCINKTCTFQITQTANRGSIWVPRSQLETSKDSALSGGKLTCIYTFNHSTTSSSNSSWLPSSIVASQIVEENCSCIFSG